MKLLIKYLGYLFIISGVFRIIPLITAMIFEESITLFMISLVASIVIGAILVWYSTKLQKKDAGLTPSRGFVLASLSFILLPLFGAISFLPSFDFHIGNALFESVSGFTTTGLTLYSSVEQLPKSLLLWRSLTQWMGGIGVIMVFLFLMSRFHIPRSTSEVSSEDIRPSLTLYNLQGFGEKIEANLKKSMTTVICIYCGYTVLGIVLFFLVGLPVYEALAMTFTSLSTGGFIVHDSFSTRTAVIAVSTIMMLLGATSFVTHSKLMKRKWRDFFNAFEKNVFGLLLLIAIGIGLLVYPSLKMVVFELVSAFTTTGYTATSLALLPEALLLLIMTGMVIGGSSGSTSGGVKVFRIYTLLRAIPWTVKKMISPLSAVIPFPVIGKKRSMDQLFAVGVFLFTYFFILLVGTICFMLFGHSFFDASFHVVSALGTVGLQTIDLSELNMFLKSILMLAMILGRLEIFPVFVLFRELIHRSNRALQP